MIDVANYGHVPKGPGVVADRPRLRLLHRRGGGAARPAAQPQARRPPDPARAPVRRVRRTLHAASLLEADPALRGRASCASRTDELLFRINDRLAAPNTDATFAAIRPELDAFCRELFGAPCDLTRTGDAKGLFSVKITNGAKTDVGTLLARLGGAPLADRSLV